LLLFFKKEALAFLGVHFMRFLWLAVLVFALPAQAADLTKLRVTIPVPLISVYPLMVAQDQGFFAKEGYDVEIISTNGDGPDVDALISGSVDFTVSTPNRLMTAYEQGKPLLAAMNVLNRMTLDCTLNKASAEKAGITPAMSLDDKLKRLRGMTLAGTRPGAATYLLAEYYARRAGLEPQKDVTIVGIGGPSAMVPAVENGRVDVVCGASPVPEFPIYHGKGVALTDNTGGGDPVFDDMLWELLYVRPDMAKNDPEKIRRVVRAMVAAIHWIHVTTPEGQLPEMRERFTGTPDDLLVSILKNSLSAFKEGGTITQTEVDKASAFLLKTNSIAKAPPWNAVATNEFNVP
jgi:NitT/TauT family transport system substrate-binding protein